MIRLSSEVMVGDVRDHQDHQDHSGAPDVGYSTAVVNELRCFKRVDPGGAQHREEIWPPVPCRW
jgi:hypothetical protein